MLVLHSRLRPRTLSLVAAAAALVLASACSSDDTAPETTHEIDGTSVPVGNGSAYAYVISGPNGASSIGVALTNTALNGLPSSDAEWTLPLPAGTAPAPFDHIMIDWNAAGHPPAPYMLPHFDFHFYTITTAAQSAIVGGPDTVTVPAANVPKDYFSGVEAVPDMGVHWIDSTSAELHGQTFTRTLIYGFYHGNMAFIEPMVTRAFLASSPDVSAAIKQPQSFARAGSYPMTYSVHTDPVTQTVRVSLDSLVAR